VAKRNNITLLNYVLQTERKKTVNDDKTILLNIITVEVYCMTEKERKITVNKT